MTGEMDVPVVSGTVTGDAGNTESTVIDTVAVARIDAGTRASCCSMVKVVAASAFAGVPEIAPLVELTVRPVGSAGLTLYVKAGDTG